MSTLHEGVKVTLGKEAFIVPALTFKHLRVLKDKLKLLVNVGNIPEGEQLDAVLDIVLMALQRNYPDMTKEKLEDIVDLNTLPVLVTSIMGISGLERTTGEALSPEA